MEIIVNKCKGCQFAFAEYEENKIKFADCLHPTTERFYIDSYYKNYTSPKWCQLKKEDITIKFKERGE